jgi:hypothetical protein
VHVDDARAVSSKDTEEPDCRLAILKQASDEAHRLSAQQRIRKGIDMHRDLGGECGEVRVGERLPWIAIRDQEDLCVIRGKASHEGVHGLLGPSKTASIARAPDRQSQRRLSANPISHGA